jgi:benzoyl-CoA reductase/2-hydroxyglutaryl-CoA dehydratase subunit BcrC/BadD/HgdB
MTTLPSQIDLQEWDRRYGQTPPDALRKFGDLRPLGHFVDEGDWRLRGLRFDSSLASLSLWNLLLSESQRLFQSRRDGQIIIAAMKDLGTVPIMAYALPETISFYPDGAWWVPCIMQRSTRDLDEADRLGIDESFCPVRAMLGAFVTQLHFPKPDLLICSVGATCDDFSSIAQRLESLGFAILWWEIPPRRKPEANEPSVTLPGGCIAPAVQVQFIRGELQRVRQAIERTTGRELSDQRLSAAIHSANQIRRQLQELRQLTFNAARCPLPALELLIAEMLAIHYCSDRDLTIKVYGQLLDEVRRRVAGGEGMLKADAVRVYWVNPVADLQAMNLLEQCGGRLCGTDFMFCHAIDEIPEDIEPLEALARTALADPMVGSCGDRAARICREARQLRAEAIVVSRIPGASHCAVEGRVIRDSVAASLGVPVVEIEVPPLNDAVREALRNRLEALIETAVARRHG